MGNYETGCNPPCEYGCPGCYCGNNCNCGCDEHTCNECGPGCQCDAPDGE